MKISTCKYIPKMVDGKLDKHNAMMQCVHGFKRHTINDLQELYSLTNKNIVYSPVFFENNHRMKENAELTIDLMVFDIDDGKTMEMVLNSKLGTTYEILLLKTASWTPKLEKYRVFIPLKYPISFNNTDEYREFYKFIDSYYDLNCDNPVMEAGRGYIGVKGREAIISSGEKWLDLTKTADKIMKQIRRKLLKDQLERERKDEELKKYRLIHNIKVPTPFEIINEDKFKEISQTLGPGNKYSVVFKLLSYCKFRGQVAIEAADSIMLLRLDGEYSNEKDLIKKFNKLK